MINNEAEQVLCSVMDGHLNIKRVPSPLRLSRLKKQEVLIYGGFTVRSLYFLLEGNCGVSVSDADGIVTIEEIYRPMQVFGAAEYFSGMSEFLASVYISSDSALILECPAEFFSKCVKDCHELSVMLNVYLAGLLARNMQHSDEFGEAPPHLELIEYFYINSIDKELPYMFGISRDELSHRLRMNQRTLYRALRRLEDEGYISNTRGKTEISGENFSRLEKVFAPGAKRG